LLRNGKVKLADFGFAVTAMENLEGPRGTQGYIAPEMRLGNYSHRVDIYSFGVTLYGIFFQYPFAKENFHLTLKEGLKNENEPDKLTLWSLICKCCSDDPQQRPTFDEITTTLEGMKSSAEHPLFKETETFSSSPETSKSRPTSILTNRDAVHYVSTLNGMTKEGREKYCKETKEKLLKKKIQEYKTEIEKCEKEMKELDQAFDFVEQVRVKAPSNET